MIGGSNSATPITNHPITQSPLSKWDIFHYVYVIDQYQVSTDKRSGIVNDPNNPEDPQYIVRLIGQVIGVSLATIAIVNNLPPLAIRMDDATVRSPNL